MPKLIQFCFIDIQYITLSNKDNNYNQTNNTNENI